MQKSFFLYGMLALSVLALSLYLLFYNGKGKRISYQDVAPPVENIKDRSAFRFAQDGKFRGMHIQSDHNITKDELLPLVRSNIEWIVHTPYLRQDNYNSTEIKVYDYTDYFNIQKENYKTDLLKSANACNIKTVVKPLIWFDKPGAGEWRGTIRFENESDWTIWSNNYRTIILRQARDCEAMGVEAFCVGTELTSIVESHPDFLRELIKEVRAIYTGTVLYAANWDREYELVPFWDEVDYIGISAYFPLTKKSFPSVRKIRRGWEKHLVQIEAVSKQFNKPVVFTEVGYRSSSKAAERPWEWGKDAHTLGEKVSPSTQVNCYEALFQSCWDKEWFAGVLLWEWRIGAPLPADLVSINFNTQAKPAEAVIARWFGE